MLKSVNKIACQIDKIFSDDKKELDLYLVNSMYDKSGYFIGSFECWLRDITLYDGGYLLYRIANHLLSEDKHLNKDDCNIEFVLINKTLLDIPMIQRYVKSIMLDYLIQENINETEEICK